MIRNKVLVFAFAALVLLASAMLPWRVSYGMHPGMMGMGPGMMGMGPGMMGMMGSGMMGMHPGMTGPCTMGSGMMGMGMMGPGMGMGPGMMGPGMMGTGGGYGPWAMLNLDEAQQKKITDIQGELWKQHVDLMGKMSDEYAKLHQLYSSSKRDPAAISDQYKRIADLERQTVESSIAAQSRYEAVLTPEQKERMQGYNWWMW